jgi:hypothetical protein
LYNPLLPIRIGEKVIWVGLNVATVVLFWVIRARHEGELAERQRKATEDKVYADAYFACLAAGGTKHEAYLAARKAINKE